MIIKLYLFVKEYWMEVLITVFMTIGIVFCTGIYLILANETSPRDISALIAVIIGSTFFVLAIIIAFVRLRRDNKKTKARETREIERDKRDEERNKRDEERFKITQQQMVLEIEKLEREKPYSGTGTL